MYKNSIKSVEETLGPIESNVWISKGYEPNRIGLTDSYTFEERKKFYTHLYKEHLVGVEEGKEPSQRIEVSTGKSWAFSMDKFRHTEEITAKEYPMNRHFLNSAYEILKEPLENMPVYINDNSYMRRAMAKWRLELGK